jgi:hypothetical protein
VPNCNELEKLQCQRIDAVNVLRECCNFEVAGCKQCKQRKERLVALTTIVLTLLKMSKEGAYWGLSCRE